MRTCRWALAVTATSCSPRSSTRCIARAFVHVAWSPSTHACSNRLAAALAFDSLQTRKHTSIGSLHAMSMSTSPAAEGDAGGESWCGHELLNTVTTEWVQDHLHDPEVALVDIRGRVNKKREEGSDYFSTSYEGLNEDYLDAHIPGAVFVDWTKDIARVDDDGVPAQLTDRDTFVEAMEEKGVGGTKRVVVYDNGDMLFATRFWWAMRRFGHDRVSVMDGGWAKWQAEKRDITPDCPCPLKVYTEWTTPPERERPELVASAADVRAVLEDKGGRVRLLDARAAAQFTGEVRRARRAGHIPGAVNTPYRAFLTDRIGQDGPYRVFKGLDGIKEVFEAASVDTSPSAPPAIAYCNGGVASTVALFLLYQLQQGRHSAGATSTGGDGGGGDSGGCGSWANYDGSWNEWGNDETAPVET